MGRFTKIAQADFIDYSKKIPEALLYKAAEDLNKKNEETDALLGNLNKLLAVRVAPSVEAQTDYKNVTDSFIAAKNEIIDEMEKNPADMHKHNFKVKKLASQIADSYTNGELKALKEQGDSYWANLDTAKITYKDQPELFNLYKSDLDKNVSSQKRNSDLNTYGTLQNPEMYRHFDQKEQQAWVSTAIKDIAVKENIDDIEARRLLKTQAQDVYALSEKDRITRDKIIKSLAGAFPQEFINSNNQYNRATGYNYPNTNTPIDESSYFLNGAFNPATRSGRLLESAVSAAEQEKTTITSISKPQASGGSGSSSSSSSADPYHSWYIHPMIKSTGSILNKIDPNDTDTYTATRNTHLETVDLLIDATLDPTSWINDTQFVKEGKVNPFTRGRINNSDKKTNTFNPSDIEFYPNSNTLRIRKISDKPLIVPETTFDTGTGLLSVNTPNQPNFYTYTTFNLNNKKDKALAKDYIKRFGYFTQDFVPKPSVSVKNQKISVANQEAANEQFQYDE